MGFLDRCRVGAHSSGSASSRTASAARRQWESPGSFGCSLQPLRLRLRRRLRPVSPRTRLACGHALPVCGTCGFRSGCVREREIPRLRLRGLRRARLDAVSPDAAGVAPVARANVRGADRTERRHIGVHVQVGVAAAEPADEAAVERIRLPSALWGPNYSIRAKIDLDERALFSKQTGILSRFCTQLSWSQLI